MCGLKYLNSLFSCFSLCAEAKGEFWELHGPAGEDGRRSGAMARGARRESGLQPFRRAERGSGPEGAAPLLLGCGSAACLREAEPSTPIARPAITALIRNVFSYGQRLKMLETWGFISGSQL